MPTASIAQITGQVYDLLTPLEADERRRLLSAIEALFGDSSPRHGATRRDDTPELEDDAQLPKALGTKAKRWMKHEGLTAAELTEVFHFDDAGSVELIATEIPGTTKKDKTANVYLLSGARSLLQSDEPTVDNGVAIAYCKHVGCYDKNNHSANRNALGNKITGSVASGFTLPAPGLKAAAAAIKIIAKPSSS